MRIRFPLFGPILGWEMTTIARRLRYFLLRALYVSFLLLTLWSAYTETFARRYWAAAVSDIQLFSQFAANFVVQFNICQLSAVLLLTPAYVASSISIEKERRTIEYLFATDLRNREITLGKWAARSLNVLVVILAGVPILFLSLFFGGVDAMQTLALTAACVATLASTAALSLLVSVHSKTTRIAISNAYGMLALLLLAPWIFYLLCWMARSTFEWLGFGANSAQPLSGVSQAIYAFLLAAEPYVLITNVLQSSFVSARGQAAVDVDALLLFVGIHLGIALVMLGWATWQIRRAYLRSVDSSARKRPRLSSITSRFRRVGKLGDYPMVWKEWYFDHSGGRNWLSYLIGFIMLFVILGTMVSILANSSMRAGESMNMLIRVVGTLVLGLTYLRVAMRSATSIGAERDRDCWVSLLTTPLSGAEIVRGKFVGAFKPVVWYVALFSPVWLFGMITGGLSPFALPALLIAIVAYAVFIAGLGVYQSLRQPTTGKAIGVTLGVCAFIGGIGHLIGMLILIPLAAIARDSETLMMVYILALPWFVLGALPFSNRELPPDNEVATGIVIGAFYLVVFTVAGLAFLAAAVRNFSQLTGRCDQNPVPEEEPAHETPST